jgi:hypothetical protein
MEQYPIPVIAQADYAAFQSFAELELPETYDEWLQQHARYERDRLQLGHDIRRIEVHPGEFSRYCDYLQVAHSRKALGDFADAKAADRRY